MRRGPHPPRGEAYCRCRGCYRKRRWGWGRGGEEGPRTADGTELERAQPRVRINECRANPAAILGRTPACTSASRTSPALPALECGQLSSAATTQNRASPLSPLATPPPELRASLLQTTEYYMRPRRHWLLRVSSVEKQAGVHSRQPDKLWSRGEGASFPLEQAAVQAGGMLQLQEEFCQKVKTENHGLLSNKTLSIHKTNHSSNLYYERKK